MANPFASQVKNTSAAKFKALTGKKSSGQSNPNGAQDSKAKAFKKGKSSDAEYNVGGSVSSGRLDKPARRQFGGSVKKPQEVKPLKITPDSESKTNWMKGLSEKEIAQTLGSTSRDPETGMRGHKKGGAVEAFARGGKAKGKKGSKTNINIIIAGKDKDKEEGGLPMPPPMMRPPMAPPPGMGPPGGPPGVPSMPGSPMPPMKRGGKVPMKAGAETGQGRLEKARAYRNG